MYQIPQRKVTFSCIGVEKANTTVKFERKKATSFNPFVTSAPFLYPWKYQKTLRFSDIFRGVMKECIGNEQVKVTWCHIFLFQTFGKCFLPSPIQCHWSISITLKTSKNPWFSNVSRGSRKRPAAWNRFISKWLISVKVIKLEGFTIASLQHIDLSRI